MWSGWQEHLDTLRAYKPVTFQLQGETLHGNDIRVTGVLNRRSVVSYTTSMAEALSERLYMKAKGCHHVRITHH
jgi:hypothetical protein